MDQQHSNHWQQMFERRRRDLPPDQGGSPGHNNARPQGGAPFGYDDGYDPARGADAARQHTPLSPEDITDEAAMALACDASEYRPWTIQRGHGRPAMMLHLRRYEPKSGLWQGWQLSYSHLVAVEYTGDTFLSLDFGSTRQFVIEGTGLGELTRHLQSGSVLMVQEYAEGIWSNKNVNCVITSIKIL